MENTQSASLESVQPEKQSAELSYGYVKKSNSSDIFSLGGQVTMGCKDFNLTIDGGRLLGIVKSQIESLISSGCISVSPCQMLPLPAL